MGHTAIVILREVVEIALILTVVLAATRGLPNRQRWIWSGIVAGLLGAGMIALFTEQLSNMMDGLGQEVFNGCIMIAAAALIGWTVVWMQTHGRELSNKIRVLGGQVAAGEVPEHVLSIVIALAIFREGAEIILFSQAILASGTADTAEFLTGVVLGVAGGVAIGVAFYLGMIKTFAKHFFAITAVLLVLISAGMAAKGVTFLAAAGLLPEFGYAIWDSSGILPEDSMLGETLSILIGYSDQPTGIQLMTYIAVVLVLLGLMRWQQQHMAAKAA